MELQEFISTTLVQIVKGIENAKEQLKDSKAIINPRNVSTGGVTHPSIHGYLDTHKQFYKVVQKIDFDVAVTAEKAKETSGAIGIHVGSIGLGSKGRSESNSSVVSRIQFSIPIVLPMEDAPFDKDDPKPQP